MNGRLQYGLLACRLPETIGKSRNSSAIHREILEALFLLGKHSGTYIYNLVTKPEANDILVTSFSYIVVQKETLRI